MTETIDKRADAATSEGSDEATQDHEVAVRGQTRPEPVPSATEAGIASEGVEQPPEPDPLEAARTEAAENRDRWLRAVADLENYKKRSMQEKTKILKYKNEDLLRDLLPIVDNLERALPYCQQDEPSNALAKGVCMIGAMFRDVIEKYGAKSLTALGEPFDPHVHEAIGRVPTAEAKPNVVMQELEKGYMYQDRLLRPAKVVVSAPVAQETNPTE